MRLTIVLIVFLAGCERHTSWPPSGVYLGYYTYGYEVSSFVPVGSRETWWLSGVTPCQEELLREQRQSAAGLHANPTIYVEVRGALTSKGKYGHLGNYSRELEVQQALACRRLWPDERHEF
jgi:hypothetical protein